MNKLLFLLLASLQSCLSGNYVLIESSTKARVELDGYTACNSTPCRIKLRIKENRFVLPWHWARCAGTYNILESFPKKNASGFTQKKEVFSRCTTYFSDDDYIYFDMHSSYGTEIKRRKKKK